VDELDAKVLFGGILNNEIGTLVLEPCSCATTYTPKRKKRL
jgi:hypothetical protein